MLVVHKYSDILTRSRCICMNDELDKASQCSQELMTLYT